MTVETEIDNAKISDSLDKLFLYHGKFFHLTFFLQTTYQHFREFDLLVWFSRTRCAGMLIHLKNFLRQSITIERDFVSVDLLS